MDTLRARARTSLPQSIRKQLPLQIFVWLGLLFLIIFSIVPMAGLLISVKDYSIKTGFLGIFTSPFVGLKHFSEFFGDRKFPGLLANTVAISVLKLLFCFPLPILFAIMLNEMRHPRWKRWVQTVSYLPHFVSWVIVSGMLFAFLSTTGGVINELLLRLGLIQEAVPFLTDPKYYYALVVLSEMWKEMGWSAIIFLAAITGIDPTLYETAQIDGAGRIKRILHITLPSILGTVSVVLILNLGSMFQGNANFEQSLLLGNAMNISRSEILPVYVYKTGLGGGRYSFAAAVGLFQSLISLALVIGSNAFSRKLTGASLY